MIASRSTGARRDRSPAGRSVSAWSMMAATGRMGMPSRRARLIEPEQLGDQGQGHDRGGSLLAHLAQEGRHVARQAGVEIVGCRPDGGDGRAVALAGEDDAAGPERQDDEGHLGAAARVAGAPEGVGQDGLQADVAQLVGRPDGEEVVDVPAQHHAARQPRVVGARELLDEAGAGLGARRARLLAGHRGRRSGRRQICGRSGGEAPAGGSAGGAASLVLASRSAGAGAAGIPSRSARRAARTASRESSPAISLPS